MVKTLVKKLLDALLDKPLAPPSETEVLLFSELKAAFHEMDILKTSHVNPSEAIWLGYVNRLRELVLSGNPREFLRWDVVSKTMFLVHAPYIYRELKYLKRRPDWESRWKPAIKESPVGRPNRCVYHPQSSANLIHHAYHVANFEDRTGIHVNDLDCVCEFGGGYGSMCRLFFNLGFRGRYLILDLPAFSALQRYFLKTVGLPVLSTKMFEETDCGVSCISHADELRQFVSNRSRWNKSLFVATWSISETSIEVRESILPMTSEFEFFLLAYQDRFREVDNTAFFNRWKESNRDVTWHGWQIEHIPGSSYLVGSRTYLAQSAPEDQQHMTRKV